MICSLGEDLASSIAPHLFQFVKLPALWLENVSDHIDVID
jgi:hypothetical protein